MSEDEQAAPTLGQRLDALARRRAAAHQPRLAWVLPLAAVLRRAERLGDVTGNRFERTDAPPPPSTSPPPGIPARELGRTAPDARLPRPPARPRPQVPPPAGPPDAHAPPAGPPDTYAPAAWPGAGPPDVHAPPAGPAPGDEPPQAVPPDVRHRLRQAAGPAADLMRVHLGPASDALARVAEADAVTVGADVHVRRDRYAPRRPEGLALLAHEATHVAALIDPGRAWRRTVGDDRDEEALARRHERDLLGRAAASDHPHPDVGPPSLLAARSAAVPMAPAGRGPIGPAPSIGPAPAPPAAAAPAAAPPGGPAIRRAATDRDTTAPAVPDLESLRRGLVSEVMRQLKTEFERGG
jgi:hypothetical protein